ncbi:uncharacterized protein [Scyliorhinus torazame]|uniref:uncharacterized protein isoform X2 n=1 Tax=Scyliorhinus torazame TaxID=75743 RepID=UPI003B5C5857
MAVQPLAEMVEIAVREFTSEADAVQPSSQAAEDDDANPTGKRRRVEAKPLDAEEGEDNIQTLLYAASRTLCLRLDSIEAHLNSMEDKCKCLRAKVDMLANQNALRPLLAEQATGEGQRQASNAGGSSLTILPKKPCDSAEDAPAPRGTGVGPKRRASQEPLECQDGEPGQVQQGVQGLGPRVHIVALCADGLGGEGEEEDDEEEQADGGVALLPDATNLLYQLMY